MHDIGKIGIRSDDLNKPQKLTPEEYTDVQEPPGAGASASSSRSASSRTSCPASTTTTRRGTARATPRASTATDIPLDGRILAVADSYDAMTSNRPYRKALPHDIAIAEFKRCAGKQFDAEAVRAFLGTIEQYRHERRAQGLPVPE